MLQFYTSCVVLGQLSDECSILSTSKNWICLWHWSAVWLFFPTVWFFNLNSIANQCHSRWDPCGSGLAAPSPSDGRGGVYEDLKWTSLLCCELPFAQTVDSGLSEHQPAEPCQLLNATKPESGKFIMSDITVIVFINL